MELAKAVEPVLVASGNGRSNKEPVRRGSMGKGSATTLESSGSALADDAMSDLKNVAVG